MISPNYSILKPTVFVLTSIYAKVFGHFMATTRSCDVTPRSKYQKSKGHPWSPCASNLVQFRLLFTKLRHFGKNGTRNFSLIGRHLESASSTKLGFELVRALSERKPTCEFWSNSGYFSSVIVVTAQVGTFVPGERSKVKWSYK